MTGVIPDYTQIAKEPLFSGAHALPSCARNPRNWGFRAITSCIRYRNRNLHSAVMHVLRESFWNWRLWVVADREPFLDIGPMRHFGSVAVKDRIHDGTVAT